MTTEEDQLRAISNRVIQLDKDCRGYTYPSIRRINILLAQATATLMDAIEAELRTLREKHPEKQQPQEHG